MVTRAGPGGSDCHNNLSMLDLKHNSNNSIDYSSPHRRCKSFLPPVGKGVRISIVAVPAVTSGPH
jgi:hypothetical protein